jgi:hypothetical protein
VIAAAGDLCATATDCAGTANLIDSIDSTRVLALGDNAYNDGTLSQYKQYYEPRARSRTGTSRGFSSGYHGSNSGFDAFWRDLYAAGVDVVLNGHDHDYERFAPQSPSGVADPNGIREFVAGTGGASHYAFNAPIANSEVRDKTSYGVLKLTLHPGSYDWQFLLVAGASFTDSGTTACH